MILKLMSSDATMFDEEARPCRIVDKVRQVRFYKLDKSGENALDVSYEEPLLGLREETFILNGYAYLMNDQGKTVQTFSRGHE